MENPADTLRSEIMAAASQKSLGKQSALAAALDMSAPYLSDILRHRRRLTPDIVDKAIKVLGVSETRGLRWHKLGAMESGWKVG